MLTIATFVDGCEQPSDADYEGGLKKRQMVLEFDMATWRVRKFPYNTYIALIVVSH